MNNTELTKFIKDAVENSDGITALTIFTKIIVSRIIACQTQTLEQIEEALKLHKVERVLEELNTSKEILEIHQVEEILEELTGSKQISRMMIRRNGRSLAYYFPLGTTFEFSYDPS